MELLQRTISFLLNSNKTLKVNELTYSFFSLYPVINICYFCNTGESRDGDDTKADLDESEIKTDGAVGTGGGSRPGSFLDPNADLFEDKLRKEDSEIGMYTCASDISFKI